MSHPLAGSKTLVVHSTLQSKHIKCCRSTVWPVYCKIDYIVYSTHNSHTYQLTSLSIQTSRKTFIPVKKHGYV